MDVEGLLAKYGGHGRYQQMLTLFLYFTIVPVTSLIVFGNLLCLLIPNHWCYIPELEGLNLTQEEIKKFSLPHDEVLNDYSQCYMYNINFTDYYEKTNSIVPLTNWSSNLKKCEQGWIYDYSIIYPTIVSEKNWVCDEAWRVYMLHTLYWGSCSVGCIVSGIFSSSQGRVSVIFMAYFISGVGGIVTAFADDYLIFALGRILVGFTAQALNLAAYVIVMEYTTVKGRLMVSTIFMFSFPIMNILMQISAYLLKDWRIINWAATGPAFIVCIITLFVPESIRWLLTKGQEEKAKKILKKIAKVNKVYKSDLDFDKIKFPPVKQEGTFAIFKRPKILKLYMTLNIVWIFICNSTMLTSMYAALIWPNPFLLTTINSLGDICGNITSKYFANSLGRCKTILIFCVITAFMYALYGFIPSNYVILSICVLFISRVFATGGFGINYLYGTEIMPTVVRSESTFFRIAFGSLGFLVSSQVVYLARSGRMLPFLITSGLLLVGAFVSVRFPETLNKTLPDTFEDGEAFIDSHESLSCLRKRRKTLSILEGKESKESESSENVYTISFKEPKESESTENILQRDM